MDKLLKLLKFAEEKPKEFDEYVYSIADTIEDKKSEIDGLAKCNIEEKETIEKICREVRKYN